MNFRKLNNISGWVIFVIASLVYILTTEQRGSFWDCGEFVSACYKVQLPHPPGAPLFILLGRFFIIIFGDNPMTAAKAVNIMNAVASGATILFLFWTITHFARKLMVGLREDPTIQQSYTILGAGAVGALAYTFSDSFWYSAVEGEVYALSSMFTALAFWSILKWERADDAAGNNRALRNRADRWIVFLFFTLGLSIGIHLLGLLVIPAAVMIYYYKRYSYTRKGAIWAFVIGCILTGLVQVVMIQWSVILAGHFDIFFVNSFKLPFFSGFAFFFILLAFLIWWGLRVANKNNWSFLRLGLWCFSFMMFGYSTYVTTMERSNANPPMDMNNVDNPMSLVYYLGREQYGSQPIFMGPHYAAPAVRDNNGNGDPVLETGKMKYAKGDNEYVKVDNDKDFTYHSRDIQLFPRVWDQSNEQRHVDFYRQWLSLDKREATELVQITEVDDGGNRLFTVNQQGKRDIYELGTEFRRQVVRGQVVQPGGTLAYEAPSYGHSIEWFLTYQMSWMYWRYFMWNFAGRQNDLQGFGNLRDGNWITGISFVDNARLGDQSKLPRSIKDKEGTNKLFLIPFILGIAGAVYHYIRDRKDWIVTLLLFFFTGVAIVVYLNQAGGQPRERDYAFTGSFYAYAIWIGLSVVGFVRLAREEAERVSFNKVLIYGSIATFLITLMSSIPSAPQGVLITCIAVTAIYAILTTIIHLLIKAAGKNSLMTAGIASTAICMIAPIIMAAEEWDDHDRSRKLLAPDIAHDYLIGCPKNAILFTFGDNDTYPLWYAQEVEGIRPDIRIVNTSLLGIDWYVNQLRYKVNESAPVDLIWTKDQLRGLNYVRNVAEDTTTVPLYTFIKDVLGNAMNNRTEASYADLAVPAKLTVPVDVDYVKSSGLVRPEDNVVPMVTLDVSGKNFFSLDQLTMLNILATTNWRRPICFTNPYQDLGFGPYLRQIGMIYQVVPVIHQGDNLDLQKTDSLLRTQFKSGGAEKGGVYFDEENRNNLMYLRMTFTRAINGMLAQGKKQEAINLLKKSEELVKPESLPYGMVSARSGANRLNIYNYHYLDAAKNAGYTELANKIKIALRKDLMEQKAYYEYLLNDKPESFGFDEDLKICNSLLEEIDKMDKPAVDPTKLLLERPGQKPPDTQIKNKDTP